MEKKKERTRSFGAREKRQLWSWGKRGAEISESKTFPGGLYLTLRERGSPLLVCLVPSGKLTFANGGFLMALRRWKLPRRCVILRCLIRDLPEFLTL